MKIFAGAGCYARTARPYFAHQLSYFRGLLFVYDLLPRYFKYVLARGAESVVLDGSERLFWRTSAAGPNCLLEGLRCITESPRMSSFACRTLEGKGIGAAVLQVTSLPTPEKDVASVKMKRGRVHKGHGGVVP